MKTKLTCFWCAWMEQHMNMAEHCFEGEVAHGSMMANNQDRKRIKKSIDGWRMKHEGETDENQNGHAFGVHEQWQCNGYHHLLHTTHFCCENFTENWSTDRFSQCFEGRFEGL